MKKIYVLPILAIILTGAGCQTANTDNVGRIDIQGNGTPNTELESNLDKKDQEPAEKENNQEETNNKDEEPMEDTTNQVSLADFKKPPTEFAGILKEEDRVNKEVTIKTSLGDITVELYGKDAPMTVSNFLILANTGFYDDVIFHRIIKGFMAQGGDPTGTGMGGPGYKFEDELDTIHKTYSRGTMAMANSGPDTNGSQFFIMHQDYPLPHNYTIFGKVTEGMDIIDKMTDLKIGSSDRPENPPVIKGIIIK